MAEQLGRIQVSAKQLWAEHPPLLRHSKKVALFELAGGLERAARGTEGPLVITRWSADAASETPCVVGAQAKVTSVEGPFSYPSPAPGSTSWHLNFADPELFAFYGGPAFAQDEIQVAEHPILACVRGFLTGRADDLLPLTRDRKHGPTPVLVRGAERWCAIDTEPEAAAPYGIYGQRLGRASDEALRQAVRRIEGGPASNILAMAAPRGSGRYTPHEIRDVLVTAIAGFQAARAESSAETRVEIVTGHWGTGAFGGHRTLMAAVQILAARIVGVDLTYHSLDDDGVLALGKGKALASAMDEGTTLDSVVAALDARAFPWGESDGN